MEQYEDEVMYKVLVVGDIGVGKTSFIKKYVHNVFSIHYKSTIGVDFALKVLHFEPNIQVRLQLWDVAGQERFSNMIRSYFHGAHCAIIFFDMTRMTTFDAVKKWKADIECKTTLNDKLIPTILIANKVDLIDENGDEWEKTDKELDDFCQQYGFLAWFKTSVKNNVNIETAMNYLVNHLLNHTPLIKVEPKPEVIQLLDIEDQSTCYC